MGKSTVLPKGTNEDVAVAQNKKKAVCPLLQTEFFLKVGDDGVSVEYIFGKAKEGTCGNKGKYKDSGKSDVLPQ